MLKSLRGVLFLEGRDRYWILITSPRTPEGYLFNTPSELVTLVLTHISSLQYTPSGTWVSPGSSMGSEETLAEKL